MTPRRDREATAGATVGATVGVTAGATVDAVLAHLAVETPDATSVVVVLARSGDPCAVDLVERVRRPVRVVDVEPDTDAHLALASGRRPHVIVDLVGETGCARRIHELFLHVHPGGLLLAVLPDAGSPLARRRARELVRDDALAPHATVAQDGELVVVRSLVDAVALVTDQDQDELLAADPDVGRVVASLEPVTWTSRAVVDSSEVLERNELRPAFDVPALALREYRRPVVMSRQRVLLERTVAPESFRDPFSRRLTSTAWERVHPRFVRRPTELAEPLAGPWFHLDPEYPNAFGHAVTETLSRLWALPQARERHPDLRILLTRPAAGPFAGWVLDLLDAAGVAREEITVVDRPVRPDLLLTASPMYVIGQTLHPDLARIWGDVGVELERTATAATASSSSPSSRPWPDRVFFTRSSPKRACHNRLELEQVLGDRGFAVVHPEDHSMADQMTFVRRASIVAGFAGSGLLHVGLTGGPKHVIVFLSQSYHAHNEYQMAALLGHRIDFVVSEPDVRHPPGGFSAAAYRSGFTFDPEREGRFLDRVLDDA